MTIVVVKAGEDRDPQPAIAGGYDTQGQNACLGPKFDVKQSGQFVNLDNPKGTISGKLEFDEGELTGDAECLDGNEQELDATVADGVMKGTLDGTPFEAALKRDVPPAGTPKPRAPDSLEAENYKVSPRSPCLGSKIAIEGDGPYEVVAKGQAVGELDYDEGAVSGEVTCPDGVTRPVYGEAVDRVINLTLLPEGGEPPTGGAPPPEGSERVVAEKQRDAGSRFAAFFIAIVVVMLVARLFGMAAVALKQPRVMGEVIAGICLGPTVLGAIAPELSTALFPSDIIPFIGVVAQLGLIFYMFLVGLEVDTQQLRGRIGQVAAISNVSVALPMMLGLAVALPIYELVGPDKKFVAFALFMGVSMSITAFPVLARILVERRMLKRPVGALALGCAAIDDVTAWFLIALATAVAVASDGNEVFVTIALAIAFCLVMALLVRPLDGARVRGLRRGRTRPGRLGRPDLRGCPAVRVHNRGNRYRADLRCVRDGPDHAAPHRPDGGRDGADRGLHDHPAPAAVLRLHRAQDRHGPARPSGAVADDGGAARRRDGGQAVRGGDRRAAHRLQLA